MATQVIHPPWEPFNIWSPTVSLGTFVSYHFYIKYKEDFPFITPLIEYEDRSDPYTIS